MITDYKSSPIDHGPEVFIKLFKETSIEAGLAASIFHQGKLHIQDLKEALRVEGVDIK